jgi:hypothetical protein
LRFWQGWEFSAAPSRPRGLAHLARLSVDTATTEAAPHPSCISMGGKSQIPMPNIPSPLRSRMPTLAKSARACPSTSSGQALSAVEGVGQLRSPRILKGGPAPQPRFSRCWKGGSAPRPVERLEEIGETIGRRQEASTMRLLVEVVIIVIVIFVAVRFFRKRG